MCNNINDINRFTITILAYFSIPDFIVSKQIISFLFVFLIKAFILMPAPPDPTTRIRLTLLLDCLTILHYQCKYHCYNISNIITVLLCFKFIHK